MGLFSTTQKNRIWDQELCCTLQMEEKGEKLLESEKHFYTKSLRILLKFF